MSRIFIKILKFVVNGAWYVLIPLMAFLSVVIAVSIFNMGYLTWDVGVDLKDVNNLSALPSLSVSQAHYFTNATAVMKMRIKLTPLMVANVVVFFSAGMFLLFGTLYQLRKILNSLRANVPFAHEHIRRLRLISLFVFLMAVMEFINSVHNYFMLPLDYPGMKDAFSVRINWGFQPIMISLVVFVLSEVFRQGYNLKTDNESFV